MSRKISQAGIDLIKSFEGCRLTAYKPVPTEPYYTIGWGHYGKDVTVGMIITQLKADSMLVLDLAKYETYVKDTAYVPVTAQLNQNQFDALVSFCYNCGPGNLKSLCKGRTIAQIADNITKYDKSSGTVLAGLVRRRKAELELFNKPDSTKVGNQVNAPNKVTVLVNGTKVADGMLDNGTTYTPARAVAEALGATVTYDALNKTVNIVSRQPS